MRDTRRQTHAAATVPGAFLTIAVACAYVTTDTSPPQAAPARRTHG
ncbi:MULTISPECIES: hypothetical protein [unclassified Streptomyces]